MNFSRKLNISRLVAASSAAAALAALLLTALPAAAAVNYYGNGNNGFGGFIGNGVLSLTDDGTNISGTLSGPGNMNDALVIYIQKGGGGFADTSGFNDQGDGLRQTISGVSGSGRSLMTFAGGFAPNYAVAMKPTSGENFGGLWGLTNGGNNSLVFKDSVNLNPVNTNGGPYTFSFPASDLGLTPGATIKLFGTYISDTAFRSTEAIAGNDSGIAGYNAFTNTSYATYVFSNAVPITFQVDMTMEVTNGGFPAGATAWAAAGFQSTAWSGFQLTNNPSAANTNIYSGTILDFDPAGTDEEFKFQIRTNGTTYWEDGVNRPFTRQSSGLTLPLVYFNSWAPAAGVPTHPVTFQVDMTPQVSLGNFVPGRDGMEARGTFLTPNWWGGGFALTNNPHGANTNLYSGTYRDANYPNGQEQYKFVIISNGTTAIYESLATNRTFITPSVSLAITNAYFNTVQLTPVSFSVDVTVQLLSGTFNPANGDTIEARGSFQNPDEWSGGFTLTNNPRASNTNIYSGTFVDQHAHGAAEEYKYVIQTNGGGVDYELPMSTGGSNRKFTLASSAQTLPTVFFNDLDWHDVALTPTQVRFTVNMTNAVDKYGSPFDPSADLVFVNGDFVPWFNWFDQFPDVDFPQYKLTNYPTFDSLLYSGVINIPAGNPLQLTYKYGIFHNSSAPAGNTNLNNEADDGFDRIRYIRSTGSYVLPTDLFGSQRTNLAAAQEISFGNLAVGKPVSGLVPVTWLGRPGVHLQSATNVSNPVWVDYPGTDGQSSTNWPLSKGIRFFRLINP